jgi:hypothetical protein
MMGEQPTDEDGPRPVLLTPTEGLDRLGKESIVSNTLSQTHPAWCSGDDIETDCGVLHVSPERVAAGFIPVSVERADSATGYGSAEIRINGAEPLTPLQAFELAGTLQAAAITALMDSEVASR